MIHGHRSKQTLGKKCCLFVFSIPSFPVIHQLRELWAQDDGPRKKKYGYSCSCGVGELVLYSSFVVETYYIWVDLRIMAYVDFVYASRILKWGADK